jgi:beta propeller repeat protein
MEGLMGSTGNIAAREVVKKGPLILLLAIIMAGAPVVASLAAVNITQVTTNAYEDSAPHMVGDYLVWQGAVNGNWEIFLYNAAAGEGPLQITQNRFDDVSPQTDGSHIVWLGFSEPDGPDGEVFLPGGEIFLYSISNGEITRITNDTHVDSPPQIAGGKVAWASHAVEDSVEPGEIFLYDIATGATQQLTDNTLDDSSPRMNDEEVAWVRKNSDGTSIFFVHAFTDGSTGSVPDGFVWRNSPQRHDNLTVLSRYDGSDREIFVYNRDSKAYHQISSNESEDGPPVIGGDGVAWTMGGEIYVAGLSIMGKAATAVGQRSFKAHWSGPAGGADSYLFDVSTKADFSSFVPGYENLNVGNTTSRYVTGLTPDTTYYYRVRAVSGSSTSENSDTISLRTRVACKACAAIFLLLLSEDDGVRGLRLSP